MYHVKKIIIAALLLSVLLLPHVTKAQSAEQVRVQLLQELVLMLQAQLELLVAKQQHTPPAIAPVSDAVFADDSSFLERIDADIVARYQVDDMQIEQRSNRHREYFARVAELVPEQYHQYFAEFVVFDSGRDTVGAFVETEVPYNQAWRYAVNEEELAYSFRSEYSSELIVHEFAHIFSLHEVFSTSQPSNCHSFFAESGCVSPDTMYGKFLTEFWDESFLDVAEDIRNARNQPRAIDDFYEQYEADFVSPYAASSPAEDFAESFAYFVLYEDESFGSQAREKIQFFNRFSEAREIKHEIRKDL